MEVPFGEFCAADDASWCCVGMGVESVVPVDAVKGGFLFYVECGDHVVSEGGVTWCDVGFGGEEFGGGVGFVFGDGVGVVCFLFGFCECGVFCIVFSVEFVVPVGDSPSGGGGEVSVEDSPLVEGGVLFFGEVVVVEELVVRFRSYPFWLPAEFRYGSPRVGVEGEGQSCSFIG